MSEQHVPVLYEEVLALLQPRPGGLYIDGTLGAGGHTAGLLQASAPDGRILAFDRDPQAIAFARQRLAQSPGHDARALVQRVTFINSSYALMAQVAPEHGFGPEQDGEGRVDGILLDLGLSSRQLADPERGFSFRQEGPLDMRFDPALPATAADLVNELPEAELADIFWRYGEERRSRHFARAVVQARPLRTTTQLAETIAAVAGRQRHKRIHPATQIFQALRIAVNRELDELEAGLAAAITLLKPGGRLAVISFHSLEDRVVKHTFREQSRDCVCPPHQPICTCDARPVLRLVTRKAVQASETEVQANPRSRSARLRVAEKLPQKQAGGV